MGVNGTGAAASKVSVNPFPWGAACLRCPFAPMAAPGKAARPKPWRCLAAFFRGRRWGEGAFLVRFPWLLGLWLGGGRFFGALPAGLRPIALTGACGRCPGFLLGWRPVRARSRLFEKRRPKNFYARFARPTPCAHVRYSLDEHERQRASRLPARSVLNGPHWGPAPPQRGRQDLAFCKLLVAHLLGSPSGGAGTAAAVTERARPYRPGKALRCFPSFLSCAARL